MQLWVHRGCKQPMQSAGNVCELYAMHVQRGLRGHCLRNQVPWDDGERLHWQRPLQPRRHMHVQHWVPTGQLLRTVPWWRRQHLQRSWHLRRQGSVQLR